MDLITTNVYSKNLSSRLLICGTCIPDEWPEVVKELSPGRTILTTCLELVALNIVLGKIASILAKSTIEEVVVLTKDGSPHCIGLHFLVEWAVKMTKSDKVVVRYFVVEHGVLHEVPANKIEEKRHLSR